MFRFIFALLPPSHKANIFKSITVNLLEWCVNHWLGREFRAMQGQKWRRIVERSDAYSPNNLFKTKLKCKKYDMWGILIQITCQNWSQNMIASTRAASRIFKLRAKWPPTLMNDMVHMHYKGEPSSGILHKLAHYFSSMQYCGTAATTSITVSTFS